MVAEAIAAAEAAAPVVEGASAFTKGLSDKGEDKEKSKYQIHTDFQSTPWQNIGKDNVASDARLKRKEMVERLFADKNGAIDAFSKIDAYMYNYNDKAHNLYGDRNGIDNEPHFGPIAQDLAKNPVTEGTVHQDENGYLMVDTRQLTLTNTAMISQLARKVQELEERLGGR